jgi:hypothetical protein
MYEKTYINARSSFMKRNIFSLIGIAVLVAVIGFSLVGCDTDTGGDTTYTVGFDAGDGSGTPPASQTVNAGQSITLPGQGTMTAPTSKSFNGWRTDGQNYAAGANYTVNGNVTFTAQWETTGGGDSTYTVGFDAGDGSGTPPASQTVNAGQSITLPGQGNMTAPTGKSFNGWETGGQNYAVGGSYTVNGNVTFTAQWQTTGGNDAPSVSFTAITDMKVGTADFRAIAYGNGTFVAVGNYKAAYSINGTAWTAVSDTLTNFLIYGIAYGKDTFVAVGSSGKAIYSGNGITWHTVTNPKFGNSNIRCITYANGFFVAGGDGGKAAYSQNGTDWTAVGNTQVAGGIYDIAYGGGKFVAVGYQGKAAYSEDVMNWVAITDVKAGNPYSLEAIAYGSNKFVAGGGINGSYSSDGINWTGNVDMKIGYNGADDIAYGGNKFVAVSVYYAAYSEDGINWVKVSDTTFSSSSHIYAIAYGGGKFVAVGSDGKGAYWAP